VSLDPQPEPAPHAPLEPPPPSVVLGHEEVVLRWTPAKARAVPELVQAVEAFQPLGDWEAGQAAARWLRERALSVPPESATYLLVRSGAVMGFFALAAGQVQLSRRDVGELGLARRTQPAVILTWMARAADSEPGAGKRMTTFAVGLARRATEYLGATLLGLDPFDQEVGQYWLGRGFQESELPPPGKDEDHPIKRLWLPLWS
jgi:hypothetical protein